MPNSNNSQNRNRDYRNRGFSGGNQHRNRSRGGRGDNNRVEANSQNQQVISTDTAGPDYPFQTILYEKFSDRITEILQNDRNGPETEVEFRLGRMYYRNNKLAFSPNLPYDHFIKVVQILKSDSNYWDSITETHFTEYQDKSVRVRFDGDKIHEIVDKKRLLDFTANLRKPYFDIRLSISKENKAENITPQYLVTLRRNRPPIDKQRSTFIKDFVGVILTTYKTENKTIRQVEVEIDLEKARRASSKFVVFTLIEYISLLMRAR